MKPLQTFNEDYVIHNTNCIVHYEAFVNSFTCDHLHMKVRTFDRVVKLAQVTLRLIKYCRCCIFVFCDRDKAREKLRQEKMKTFEETGEMPGHRKKHVKVCISVLVNFRLQLTEDFVVLKLVSPLQVTH